MTDIESSGRSDGRLAELLNFSRDGDVFTAQTPGGSSDGRLFGGLIAARALAAAGATVEDDKLPHSMHAYFIRGGHYGSDIVLHVERVRDGRSFATRRVTVEQNNAAIFEMIASFHRPEDGTDGYPPPVPALALEDSVEVGTTMVLSSTFEMRGRAEDPEPFVLAPFWIRTRRPVDDNPLLQACVLTLMSDIGPVPAARPPGASLAALMTPNLAASLDHSIWFHRPFDPHEWHCYDITPVTTGNARGLVRGGLVNRAGELIASTSQEALWRG